MICLDLTAGGSGADHGPAAAAAAAADLQGHPHWQGPTIPALLLLLLLPPSPNAPGA
jgi:hypothetical protein